MNESLDNLFIKTKTSGFSSPAEVYVTKRLNLNELVVDDIFTTFYFKFEGECTFGVNPGDVLVVDKSKDYKDGDLVVIVNQEKFVIREFNGQEGVWGKVTWVLKRR